MDKTDKFKEGKLKIVKVFLAFIILFLYLFITYGGVDHSSHLNQWNYAAGLYPYTNDPFLPYAASIKTSFLLYEIVNFFKIQMTNDFHGFAVHTLLSIFSGFFLYKIIKEYTFIKDTNAALIIIFAILTIDKHFLLSANYASWITAHNGSTFQFGHALIYIFFWALLKKSIPLLAVLSSLMLLIAVKATYFTIGVGMLYFLFFVRPLQKSIWIISPIATVLYLTSIEINTISPVMFGKDYMPNPDDYFTKLNIFNSVINREEEESSFHLQNNFNLFKFIISFPIFFFLQKKIPKGEFKNLLIIILFVSIMAFVWGWFYHQYGGRIWPDPRVASLGPVRGVEVYELFFAILIGITICKLKINTLYKIGWLAVFFYATSGIKGILVGLAILILIYLIINFYKKFDFLNLKNLIFQNSKNITQFSTIFFFLLLLPGVLYSSVKIYKNGFNSYAIKKSNRWRTGPLKGNNDRMDSLVELRKCNDFVLWDHDIGEPWSNDIAGKSQFMDYGGRAINMMSKYIIDVHLERGNIWRDMERALKRGISPSQMTVNYLLHTGVVMIVKDENSKIFPKKIEKVNLKNTDTLVLFLQNEKKEDFYKNCINKIEL